MRTRNVVILASWVTAAVISTSIIWKGGATYPNIGIALFLFFAAGGISFAMGYSLHDTEELKTSRELSLLASKLEEIGERLHRIEGKVEKIEKFLEE